MSLAYDVGHAFCGVLAFDTCVDRQEVTLLGLFLLAVTGGLLSMAALSRIQ
jgi:hypothetical protein